MFNILRKLKEFPLLNCLSICILSKYGMPSAGAHVLYQVKVQEKLGINSWECILSSSLINSSVTGLF